jgi:beta-1,4-mannosyltransferase
VSVSSRDAVPAAAHAGEQKRKRRGLLTYPEGEGGRSPNPYVRLLREHVARRGLEPLTGVHFTLTGLVRARKRAGFVHFHFPDRLYRYQKGSGPVRTIGSWAKLALFMPRLWAAHALGYRIAWTIHQVYPHEPHNPRLERLGARYTAAKADALFAHDAATAERARVELGNVGGKLAIVPHASFAEAYRTGNERARGAVREELGIGPDTFAFLCFGILRAYKEIDLVVDAFRVADLSDAALVIAGPVKHEDVLRFVEKAAAGDPRIVVTGAVPEDRVAELFDACDAAVLARSDGGTSGALVLALSLGLPVIAADRPAYASLVDACEAGWLFEPREPDSLRQALERAAADPGVARAKGLAGRSCEQIPSWDEVARRVAELLDPA